MAVSYTDVQQLATEFATLSQGRIDPFLARARTRVNEAFWGSLYDDGVLYLASHLLAEAERAKGQAGPVSSMAAGPLSVSFMARADVPSEYGSTRWGVEFWRLMRTLRFQSVQAI